MAQSGQQTPNSSDEGHRQDRPRSVEDGPPQTDGSPEGASPDRQIAQEPQQSTGQGLGQS
jgi:hypothetical protein